jgi:hypothetical protein
MNKGQRICTIGILTLLLSSTVFAGDIRTGIAPPPPPPDERLGTAAVTPKAPQVVQNQGGASETIADIALSLVQTMLYVF